MAPDEPTELEIEGWCIDDAKQKIDRWRRTPNKTMQDYIEWFRATFELFNAYPDEAPEVDSQCLSVESKELSLRLLTGLKEAYIGNNKDGQYDDDIAYYQTILDRFPVRIPFGSFLVSLLEFLETHGHDEKIYQLALVLIRQKMNGLVTEEMEEVLDEIYLRLKCFD